MDNEALQALVDAPQPSTYLHVENAQLKAQMAQMKQLLDQQFLNTVSAFLNGLQLLMGMATQGDPQARLILTQLDETLQRARDGVSPLTVIRRG